MGSRKLSEIYKLDRFGELDATQRRFPFKGILLATLEDKGVIAYFLEYGEQLEDLTGDTCLLMVLRELDKIAKQLPVKKDMGLHDLIIVPPNQGDGDAYKIARRLGVGVDKLPCLVVFENFGNAVQDLAIVSVPNEAGDSLKEKLRFLISKMDECKDYHEGARLSCFRDKLRNDMIKTTAKGILKDVLSDLISAGTSKLVGLA